MACGAGAAGVASDAIPLVPQLEAELRGCRHEVYAYVCGSMTRRGLRGVEDHVRGAEALRPGTRAVARPQAAAVSVRSVPKLPFPLVPGYPCVSCWRDRVLLADISYNS